MLCSNIFQYFFFIIFAYIVFNISKGWDFFAKKTGILKINWLNFEKIEKNVSKIFDKIFYDNKISLKFIISVITLLLAILISWTVQPTFGIIFFMAAICLWQLIKTNDRTEAFSLLLVLICFGIIVGTEIYFLGDGRMNTVFKFYMVAWTFLSIALPYLFYKVIAEMKKYLLLNRKEIKLDLLYIVAGTFLLLLAIYFLQYLDMKNGTSYMQSLYIIIVIFGTIFFYIF